VISGCPACESSGWPPVEQITSLRQPACCAGDCSTGSRVHLRRPGMTVLFFSVIPETALVKVAEETCNFCVSTLDSNQSPEAIAAVVVNLDCALFLMRMDCRSNHQHRFQAGFERNRGINARVRQYSIQMFDFRAEIVRASLGIRSQRSSLPFRHRRT
jgi:hypothetical protein